MEESKFLNFRLGENFGVLLAQISREHIMTKYDPEAAYKTFSQSGASPVFALELLSGKKVIVVEPGGESCVIEDYIPSLHTNYPAPIDWREWARGEIDEKLGEGEEIMSFLKKGFLSRELTTSVKLLITEDEFKRIYNVPEYIMFGYDWKGYCELGMVDIIKLWSRKDELSDIGGIENCETLNILGSFDNFLEESTKVISCVSWIYEQYGSDKEDEVRVENLKKLIYDGSTVLSLLSDYEENEERINIILGPYKIEKDKEEEDIVDKFIRRQNIVEKELEYLSPVDITKGWDAGYISPEGKVYALCGDSCQFLHNQLADRIYELYGWKKPKENIDWELDRRGWLKFRRGECLYAGYSLNHEIPITTAQKAELIRYAKSQGSIKCGYDKKVVTEDELVGQPEEYYEELFE